MNQNEYCITAGEFAKMCQTTRDTLRYYEKQGILVPHKNEENGYHYYSYAQISSYYFIKTFRSIDCSVADIKEYLLAGEEVRFDEFVDSQYEKLLQMRMELDQKIGVIANTKRILKEIRCNDVGNPVFYSFPERMWLKLTEVTSVPATSSGEIAKDIRRHLHECNRPGIQAFPMGASIAAQNFMEENYTYKNVFSFADRLADGKDIMELPGKQAIVAVCTESDGDIRKTYKKIADCLKKEERHLSSDLYSLSIVNVIDPKEERKYLKYIFGCIE